MPKPVCVITGDVHFTPNTLELATASINAVLNKAKELDVPAVLNGDILDSKAIIRGECSNRLIELLENPPVKVYINTGNHDLLSEKSTTSALNFLRPYSTVVSYPQYIKELGCYIIPYHNNNDAFKSVLSGIPKGSRLIIHQGVIGAHLGHYVQDKTSLAPEEFADFRVVASHYHRRQDLKCGRPRKGAVGLLSYCGNPYTLSFAEANDGPKGYQILMDDGMLEFVPLDLRRHIVIETDLDRWREIEPQDPQNPLWIKITGDALDLQVLKKEDVAKVIGHNNFKLDKICTVNSSTTPKPKATTEDALLDSIIDETSESVDNKTLLKSLWREIV